MGRGEGQQKSACIKKKYMLDSRRGRGRLGGEPGVVFDNQANDKGKLAVNVRTQSCAFLFLGIGKLPNSLLRLQAICLDFFLKIEKVPGIRKELG